MSTVFPNVNKFSLMSSQFLCFLCVLPLLHTVLNSPSITLLNFCLLSPKLCEKKQILPQRTTTGICGNESKMLFSRKRRRDFLLPTSKFHTRLYTDARNFPKPTPSLGPNPSKVARSHIADDYVGIYRKELGPRTGRDFFRY